MIKNIFKVTMALCLCGLMIVNVNTLMAEGGPNTDDGSPPLDNSGGGSVNREYIDYVKPCTYTEVVFCNSYYSSITNCSLGSRVTVSLAGKSNNCQYTGNEQDVCHSFSCEPK